MDSKTPKTPLGTPASSNHTPSDKKNYALQVALQTMKERCSLVQRRLSSMEEENQRLRDAAAFVSPPSNNSKASSESSGEVTSLRSQVAELHRQKEQLEDQISMVSNENRRLWSRLSKLSKDQSQVTKEDDVTNTSHIINAGANLNLIRSKTFTQHTPNPHLRQKLISEGSLEEIALDDFDGSDIDLGYPCGLQVEDANTLNDLDANLDAKQCMEGLQDLRREAMKQQQELNVALTQLETRIVHQPCPDCAQKAANKPEMADKSLETEDELSNELKRYDKEHTSGPAYDTFNGHTTTSISSTSRLNIIQEKLKADAIDKTCPMCGKVYSSQVSFKAFQEHVEMHFIDDTLDIDGSIDRHFEFVSHAVGDF